MASERESEHGQQRDNATLCTEREAQGGLYRLYKAHAASTAVRRALRDVRDQCARPLWACQGQAPAETASLLLPPSVPGKPVIRQGGVQWPVLGGTGANPIAGGLGGETGYDPRGASDWLHDHLAHMAAALVMMLALALATAAVSVWHAAVMRC